MRGVAFCPAHITGFFKADLYSQNISADEIGSLGAGFSIKDGVTTSVEIAPQDHPSYDIKISGYNSDNTQVSQFVIVEFFKLVKNPNYHVKVRHDISVPVGFGLGCSGAVALSLTLALNQAFETNFSREEIGKLAHRAEVSCKTGLGDVLAAYHGGFEIRTRSGAPGIGKVEKIPMNSSVIMICFSPISTKEFMTEKIETINGLGGKMVKELVQSKDYELFQDMSIEFAKYVQVMTPKMREVINDLKKNGIKCGVALFGETIFSLIPIHLENKVLNIIKKYDDGIIIKSQIDNLGARLK